jgi:hypothetical protein
MRDKKMRKCKKCKTHYDLWSRTYPRDILYYLRNNEETTKFCPRCILLRIYAKPQKSHNWRVGQAAYIESELGVR